MKTSFYTLLIGSCSLFVLSCGGGNSSSNETDSSQKVTTENSASKDVSKEDKSNSNATLDFSTPSNAVESFFISGQAQNAENLSKCFSKNSAGEFKKIVDNKLEEKDLKELKELTTDAKVVEEKIEGSKATVKVKFGKRDENIRMELLDGNWVIVDF